MVDVIIVGAGVTGLQAGAELTAAGKQVVILEKSRGLGGRAATRRWEGGRIDHGAQFFTARDADFQNQVERWRGDGLCFEWCRGFHQWRNHLLTPPDAADGHPRFAVRDGMNSLGKALAAGLDVRGETTVAALRRERDRWLAVSAAGETYAAPVLLLTAPAPQALVLLQTLETPPATLLNQLETHRCAPCLAVMARYPQAPKPEWNGIQADDATVGWIGLNSAKHPLPPGQTVVIHGADGFSEDWQDRDLEEAGDRLIERAAHLAGNDWLWTPTARAVHRWRFARPLHGPPTEWFGSAPGVPGLFLAGDGFAGGKIEGAWLSGRAAARAIRQMG